MTYLQRIALSPAAVVQVELVDVSRADTPAVVFAEETIRPEHQVPIPFELVYDRSKIGPARRYGVQARTTDGDRLAFKSDQALPVLTHGTPTTVEVVVRPVGGPGADTVSARSHRRTAPGGGGEQPPSRSARPA